MKLKIKDIEREKSKDIMRKIIRFTVESKFDEINNMILQAQPDEISMREFTSLIRSSYRLHKKLDAWNPKIIQFYEYHKNNGNEQKFNEWMVGLKQFYLS